MTRSGVRLPSAPPVDIFRLETQAVSGKCEPDVANCDRKLVHKRSSTIPKSPSLSTDLAGSDWCRSVVHNPRVRSRNHAAGSSSPPSPRSSRNFPGLIVRGRVLPRRVPTSGLEARGLIPCRRQHPFRPNVLFGPTPRRLARSPIGGMRLKNRGFSCR